MNPTSHSCLEEHLSVLLNIPHAYSLQEGSDPFTELAQKKKERVQKNRKQHLENAKEAVKSGGLGALPSTLKLSAALPQKGQGGEKRKRKELKDEVRG
jgi:hypothetical protein